MKTFPIIYSVIYHREFSWVIGVLFWVILRVLCDRVLFRALSDRVLFRVLIRVLSDKVLIRVPSDRMLFSILNDSLLFRVLLSVLDPWVLAMIFSLLFPAYLEKNVFTLKYLVDFSTQERIDKIYLI